MLIFLHYCSLECQEEREKTNQVSNGVRSRTEATGSGTQVEASGSGTQRREGPTPSKQPRKTAALGSTILPDVRSSSEEQTILNEIKRYLQEPLAPAVDGGLDLNFSPCNYWKTYAHLYPNLAPLARDIFCVPGSSANIERCFSTALDIVAAKKSKMKSRLAEMILFSRRNAHLRKNLKDYINFKVTPPKTNKSNNT